MSIHETRPEATYRDARDLALADAAFVIRDLETALAVRSELLALALAQLHTLTEKIDRLKRARYDGAERQASEGARAA